MSDDKPKHSIKIDLPASIDPQVVEGMNGTQALEYIVARRGGGFPVEVIEVPQPDGGVVFTVYGIAIGVAHQEGEAMVFSWVMPARWWIKVEGEVNQYVGQEELDAMIREIGGRS